MFYGCLFVEVLLGQVHPRWLLRKNKAFKTFRTNGCKNYKLVNELFNSSTATGALRISSTDPQRTSDEDRQILEEFLSTSKEQQKQPVNLEEGSNESDDRVHVVEEPIICESRRRVHKRHFSTNSQLQECMDLFKASFKPKPKTTPPESKRSKSVFSPEKLEKNSIDEAMAELNQLKPTISIDEYMGGSLVIIDDRVRRVFMCYLEVIRRE
ncbi:hypothetical protein CDL15_Pgr023462 [Punica granatum]|uniref:Uncharacterized protein n=1 Tax=Punica granatum TaxID=22663 RepID=A0A218W6J9_PUNGR|nr:hypothetical protein CDL15_Pgr023462 [Punica granatum]